MSKKKKADPSKSQPPSGDSNLKPQAHFKTGHKLLEKLCVAPNTNDKRDVLLAYTCIFQCIGKTNNANLLSFKMVSAALS